MPEKLIPTVDKLIQRGFGINMADEDTVFMSRRRGPSTFYAEVTEADGKVIVNGKSLKDFLADL